MDSYGKMHEPLTPRASRPQEASLLQHCRHWEVQRTSPAPVWYGDHRSTILHRANLCANCTYWVSPSFSSTLIPEGHDPCWEALFLPLFHYLWVSPSLCPLLHFSTVTHLDAKLLSSCFDSNLWSG